MVLTAKEIQAEREIALEKARSREDAQAMQEVADRLARRGFDAAVVMATMVRLATDSALKAIAWADEEDARMSEVA